MSNREIVVEKAWATASYTFDVIGLFIPVGLLALLSVILVAITTSISRKLINRETVSVMIEWPFFNRFGYSQLYDFFHATVPLLVGGGVFVLGLWNLVH